MKVLFVILIIAFFGREGCVSSPEEERPEAYPVGSYTINNITVERRSVSFDLTCGVPNPCYIFAHTEYVVSGNAVDVTIYTRPGSYDPCITILGSIDVEVEIFLPHRGDYRFTFHSVSGSLDTLVTVNY